MTRFQYGIPNQYYPNPIISPEFLLDVDTFTTSTISYNEIIERISIFHIFIQKLFEDSIADSLRQKMGVKVNG